MTRNLCHCFTDEGAGNKQQWRDSRWAVLHWALFAQTGKPDSKRQCSGRARADITPQWDPSLSTQFLYHPMLVFCRPRSKTGIWNQNSCQDTVPTSTLWLGVKAERPLLSCDAIMWQCNVRPPSRLTPQVLHANNDDTYIHNSTSRLRRTRSKNVACMSICSTPVPCSQKFHTGRRPERFHLSTLQYRRATLYLIFLNTLNSKLRGFPKYSQNYLNLHCVTRHASFLPNPIFFAGFVCSDKAWPTCTTCTAMMKQIQNNYNSHCSFLQLECSFWRLVVLWRCCLSTSLEFSSAQGLPQQSCISSNFANILICCNPSNNFSLPFRDSRYVKSSTEMNSLSGNSLISWKSRRTQWSISRTTRSTSERPDIECCQYSYSFDEVDKDTTNVNEASHCDSSYSDGTLLRQHKRTTWLWFFLIYCSSNLRRIIWRQWKEW